MLSAWDSYAAHVTGDCTVGGGRAALVHLWKVVLVEKYTVIEQRCSFCYRGHEISRLPEGWDFTLNILEEDFKQCKHCGKYWSMQIKVRQIEHEQKGHCG